VSQERESDLFAAYRGLLLGAIAVLIVVFGIVKMVNATMGEKPAAGHETHQQ
jgi:hypothetical protein